MLNSFQERNQKIESFAKKKLKPIKSEIGKVNQMNKKKLKSGKRQ
jgi:hypothetical protein